ncbi:hypothetical protein B0G85_0471 [Polynucleobacter brandtiae]|uniref:Uncharacterized protein n=1 Tax=Polynucleobacter brandtiae TaxID=1938816 RepID=A0A2M8VYZ3_9BURK|nr:hypothetical protein B0G85_0471 [Polynucleobacter brandtiae]
MLKNKGSEFTDKEILEGLNHTNQTLIRHNLPLMTLEQYMESLANPVSEEILPRYLYRPNK